MGEVYRARDLRLDREVAIKILPADLAHDGDRLKRFEQEAHAISALNHPNILTIYDIGSHEGAPYLVVELLEGEELRAQLNEGALPVRKAIEYAQQIAAGLAAAHEKGIVHRDLKPENLFITNDGRVKILDFGLAKLRPRALAAGVNTEAPTMKGLTSPGMVMGTVGYMSPEQVRGQEADHRSDIFSFGIILHEMLNGRRTFTGDSMVELMNSILKDDPMDLSGTDARISPALDQIVRRCLEKKPERRFQMAADLCFALEALSIPSSSGSNLTGAVATRDVSSGLKRLGRRELSAWVGLAAMTLLASVLGVAYLLRPAPEAELLRLQVNPPERASLFDWPAISPDGRLLAFVAEVDGKTQLWVRALGTTVARPLVEIQENNPYPFWSPDSRFIAYFEQRKLKKASLAGEMPETLCDTPTQHGGAWSREGEILFGGLSAGIQRVSAKGGVVTAITRVDQERGDLYHSAPTFLPDGRHFLYHITNPDQARNGIYLGSLDGGEPRQLISTDARNVGLAMSPTERGKGYLTFVRQEGLLAQTFDFSRNELMGEPARIAEHVPTPLGYYARYSLSTNGILVLLEKEADEQLTWFDRAGKKLGMVGPAGHYSNPRISPDGRQLAIGHTNPQSQRDDIYLFDLDGGAGTPFTFDPKQDERPIWSPDGNRIVWVSWREGTSNFFVKAASGAGQDEVLLRTANQKRVSDWSFDGRFILYVEGNPRTSFDIWVLPLEGERQPWPWLVSPADERMPVFSPDGKWVAYQSNETGRNEIYLQAFVPGAPASGGKRQLSIEGGANPFWRRDGRELFYLSPDGRLMAVEILPGTELKARTARVLFTPRGFRVNADRGYTPSGDGQRFLFVTSADESGVPPFTVILNWNKSGEVW